MRKVQATITLQVLGGAGVPDGIPEGGTVCVSGYADGRDLLSVLDAAKADAVERVRAARSGEIPPLPKSHELQSRRNPPWRCPCDFATVLDSPSALCAWCANNDCPCDFAEPLADSDGWLCPCGENGVGWIKLLSSFPQ